MTKSLELLAPAKLNLFLHIIGRRADGYHLLQSVFQLIDWTDTVHLTSLNRDAIERTNPLPNVNPENDLTVRAAHLLKKYSGTKSGVAIELTKSIPMGAGLGGGSSDAASVLIGLNTLWELHLDTKVLMSLGAQLGADIPFFIFGKNAFVEGVGEKLSSVPVAERRYFVLFPGKSISTADVFQSPALIRDHTPISIEALNPQLLHHQSFTNDCQLAAIQICSEVQNALDWLQLRFPKSHPVMTGSGSSTFITLEDSDTPDFLQAALKELPPGWVGRVVRGLNQNPAYNSVIRNKL
jgi:4-diphosphocytidyl-2-C-methyl-D-erythritol kinase